MAFLVNIASSTISRALSGGPVLPFTIGEISEHNDASSLWTLHKGTKKDDSTSMSVFVFDCARNKDKLPLAKNAFKRFKTLRHPDILKYIDGAETDAQIIIGTEYAIPLSAQMKDSPNPNFISWGLYKLAQLLPRYRGLTNSQPKSREDVSLLLSRGTAGNGYFVNDFIQATLFLEQFSVKDSSEKDQFFRKLDTTLDTFPKDFCSYKILVGGISTCRNMNLTFFFLHPVFFLDPGNSQTLMKPELLNALEFGGAGVKALVPILKISKNLQTTEFESLVLPSVVKLFSLPDRAIRVSLCENLGSFINHLSTKVVSEKIFTNLATGFMDTNAIVREATLKSVLVLIPKLNERLLNNDLLRYLAKLQTDEEPGIRANTTICIGKISRMLNETTQKKVLVVAFLRSLNDPFPPSRTAGLAALAVTADLYAPMDIAQKIIPATGLLLIDPEKTVRTQAFKNMDVFVKRLEAHSATMAETAVVPKQDGVPAASASSGATGTASNASDWAGWALGAITTRLAGAAAAAPAGAMSPTTSAQSVLATDAATAAGGGGSSGSRSSGPASASSFDDARPPSMGRNSSGVSVSKAFAAPVAASGTADGWDDDSWDVGGGSEVCA
ncbi:hypothetical protein HK405_009255, partial [Cladochytrium tenue]